MASTFTTRQYRLSLWGGKYSLRLRSTDRLSLDSLEALAKRDLSFHSPMAVQATLENARKTLGAIECAASNPLLLTRSQAARRYTTALEHAHEDILAVHTKALVLLSRTPVDPRIHASRPPDDDVYYESYNWWLDTYEEVQKWATALKVRHGPELDAPWWPLLQCMVFWNPARMIPVQFLLQFLPEGERSEDRLAGFLQPLLESGVMKRTNEKGAYIPLWVRYYYQRQMRDTNRLRPYFSCTLSKVRRLGLPKLEGQEDIQDGWDVPQSTANALAYLELLVPYGNDRDGTAKWERVVRRYQERQKDCQ